MAPILNLLFASVRAESRLQACRAHDLAVCTEPLSMASYKELLALGRDPARVRAAARRLLASDEDWTQWERDFLEGLVAEYGIAGLSTQQRDKLAELREGAEYVSTIDGFDVASLIEKCWLRRLDLDYEDDIAFIEQERGSASIKRRHVERVLRCCKKLGVIERQVLRRL